MQKFEIFDYSIAQGPGQTYKYCLTNVLNGVLNYVFEMLRLVNQQTTSDIHFRFNCNVVILSQNEETGMQSICFYCISYRHGLCSHFNLEKARRPFFFPCVTSVFITIFNNSNIR